MINFNNTSQYRILPSEPRNEIPVGNSNSHCQTYQPLSQTIEKTFETFTLHNKDSFDRIKGGEIGFHVSRNSLSRKIISFAQNLMSPAKHNRDAVHVFVVCSKESDDIIDVVQANSQGLKETRLNIQDLQENEEYVFFQPMDSSLREIFVKNVLNNADRLPSSKKIEDYQKEFLKHQKQNGLYSYGDLLGTCVNSSMQNKHSLKVLISATADSLLGRPIKNLDGKRLSFICSSFSALCFQVSLLEQKLTEMRLITLLKTYDKKEIKKFLKNILKENPKFLKDINLITQLNHQWLDPATLKGTLEEISI